MKFIPVVIAAVIGIGSAHAMSSAEHTLMDMQIEHDMRAFGLDAASQDRQRMQRELDQLRREIQDEKLRRLRGY